MNRTSYLAFGLMLGAALTAPAAAQESAAPTGLSAAISGGAPILEVRARYETAEQNGAADADALTARIRLGWTTAKWNDLQGAVEFDSVTTLSGDYNDGVPPAEPYATIADPEGAELNRLQIAWTPTEAFAATLGRQRIALDDQRFIGAVGWRQDDQTFDALRLDYHSGAFRASYAYIDHVNRIFADDLDWDSESHVLNASYTFGPALKVTGFVYLLDLQDGGVALSNETYGARLTGAHAVAGFNLGYAASYATQSDYADNPNSYDADYWALELSAARGPFTARAGYESLGGEGAGRRFVTPLATGHAFQGWADVFLNTPDDGVEDLYLTGIYRAPELPFASSSTLTVTWHDYEAERTGADLGEEWNAQYASAITPHLNFLLKYADYDGVGAPADTTRTWVGLEYKL